MQYRLFLASLLLIAVTVRAQEKLMGFTQANASTQRAWEKKFDAQLRAQNLDGWMKTLTAHPHHVGSPHDKANAEFLAGLFKQWGYQTEIATYYVLFPTPKQRKLELLGAHPYTAKLEEPVIPGDSFTTQRSEQLPTYNAFSADGDVTAELVFANYGVPADYEALEKLGVDVRGKIVIAKYGGSWRGIKPKVAAEHGAVGCLIYSDPEQDGYGAGDVYPKGAMRPAAGVQRGSVMDMPVYPGDVLTPNIAATKDAKRLDRNAAPTIMKIPVLPISYEDALPLLQSLQGQVVPPGWRGGLPITYHVGPSLDKVHLQAVFNWDIKPIYNVIAKMKGAQYPDQWVVRGNHHDGWVNGAEDPVSGLVAELEEARAVSELAKTGFKPKRTLVYCAWDGEEPALLGSTEWVEDHQQEISNNVVAYINSDGNGRGFIGASGSHVLEPFFNEILNDVTDPGTGVSIGERRYAKALVDANDANRAKLLGNRYMKLDALGAGSDYSPFIQHLGIPSLNLGFGGEDQAGVYHSIYDNYNHYTKFGDPGFPYGVALAKTAGRVTLRLANADVLPFDFTAFYKTVADYSTEVKTLLDDSRKRTEAETRMLREKMFTLADDPTKKLQLPKEREPVPFLNFSPLENALQQLKEAADTFSKAYTRAVSLPAAKQAALNEMLYKAEQHLTQPAGLPRRAWYRHQIYAPGFYTGYGVKTLPAIREAIEQRQWKEAQTGIETVAQTLENYQQHIRKATLLLQQAF